MTITLNFDSLDDFIKSYGSIAATIEECKKAKMIIAGPQSTEAPQPAKTAAKTAPKAEKPADIGKPIEMDAPAVDIVAVRAALAALMRSGKRDAVTDILSRFGAENVTSLKPEDYSAVVSACSEVK